MTLVRPRLTDFHGIGDSDKMLYEASYGWPFPGFFWHYVGPTDAPYTSFPGKAYWSVDLVTFPINILTALAILGLIGFTSEKYFRRPPEDRCGEDEVRQTLYL